MLSHINDVEQARVLAAANRLHMPAAELLKKVALDHLPADAPASSPDYDIEEILHKLRQQDNVVLGPNVPTVELFEKWAEEDAHRSDAEREAEDKLWAEIEQALINRPGLQLRDLGQ